MKNKAQLKRMLEKRARRAHRKEAKPAVPICESNKVRRQAAWLATANRLVENAPADVSITILNTAHMQPAQYPSIE